MKKNWIVLLLDIPFLLQGCSTLTTPALRHETGETLGAGKFSVLGKVETGHVYPLIDPNGPVGGIAQDSSVFRGGLLGLQGSVGLTAKLDLQLASYFALGGAGWRLGAKYGLFKTGKFAAAIVGGVGRYSFNGSGSYANTTTTVNGEDPSTSSIDQNLSALQVDFSLPLSYRIGPSSILYTGFTVYSTSLDGTSNQVSIQRSSTEFGVNLGYRQSFGGSFFGDAELAVIKVDDPFAGQSPLVPYWGIGAGILF